MSLRGRERSLWVTKGPFGLLEEVTWESIEVNWDHKRLHAATGGIFDRSLRVNKSHVASLEVTWVPRGHQGSLEVTWVS